MKTATLIRDNVQPEGARSRQALYRVDPPWPNVPYIDEPASYEYVIVSELDHPTDGPETFVFGAYEDGSKGRMFELPSSQRGIMDRCKVLMDAGYAIVEQVDGGEPNVVDRLYRTEAGS